jgi:hypothetical protein
MNIHAQRLVMEASAQSAEVRKVDLMRLGRDPAFGTLLLMLSELKEQYLAAIAQQNLAAHHGCLEHCAGSIHAMTTLEERLGALVGKAPKRPQQERDEEEQ